MRKSICIVLVCSLFLLMYPCALPVNAQPIEYSQEQMESIYRTYMGYEEMMDPLFCEDTAIGYWGMVHKIQENKIKSASLDLGARWLGVYPEKEEYAQILANLMMLQSGRLASQIAYQSSFDDIKTDEDYLLDIADLALSVIGEQKCLEVISPVIDALTGGKEVLLKNQELIKYYEITLQDFTQMQAFLTAIANFSTDRNLKKVAESLSKVNKDMLENRLDYLIESGNNLLKYEAEFFIKNLSFDNLKGTDIYKSDKIVRAFVDCSAILNAQILPIIGGAEAAFEITILMGDFAFGTTNVYSRYQEMKVLSDIAEALVTAKDALVIPAETGQAQMVAIKEHCDYYKALLATHARGEYLMHQLLMQDAEGLSALRQIIESFKNPKDTTDTWYSNQISVLTQYSDKIDSLFAARYNLQTSLPETASTPNYERILNMFYTNLATGWIARDGENWEDVYDPDNATYLFAAYSDDFTLDTVGYALLDLDGNGTDELIIGWMEEASEGGIYEMYTVHQGVVVHLISAGERDIYNLAVDNSINNHASGGALCSVRTNYGIDAERGTLAANFLVKIDAYESPDNPYFSDMEMTNNLTESEAQMLLARFPENASLTLVPFCEYESPTLEKPEIADSDGVLREKYRQLLADHVQMRNDGYFGTGEYADCDYELAYTLYDINKDGVCELIVREDQWMYYVYTPWEEFVALCAEELWTYPDCLYEYDGNGILVHGGGVGSLRLEHVWLYSMTGAALELTDTMVSSEDEELESVYEYLKTLKPIDGFSDISDMSLLLKKV